MKDVVKVDKDTRIVWEVAEPAPALIECTPVLDDTLNEERIKANEPHSTDMHKYCLHDDSFICALDYLEPPATRTDL